jgi:hypothetical protein
MNAQLLQPVEHDGNGNSGSRTDSIPHVQLAHDGLVLSVKKENGNI